MKLISRSEQETKNFGKQLAAQLKGGDMVCLYGELGAGKTTLVKGIAEGFGIKEEITSPTFTLMNVYDVETTDYGQQTTASNFGAVVHSPLAVVKKLVHIDTYRLKDEKELMEIGAADYVGRPETVTIIEWPEKIENLLKGKKCIKIELKHGENGGRLIRHFLK